MQNQMRYCAFIILDECDLCVHILEEELRLRFGKNFSLWLSGRLCHQFITFSGKGEDKVRPEFILAYVSVVNCRIDFDRHPLARQFILLAKEDSCHSICDRSRAESAEIAIA